MKLRRTAQETETETAPESEVRADVPAAAEPAVLRPDVPSVGEVAAERDRVERTWPGYRDPSGPDGGTAAAAPPAEESALRPDVPSPGAASESHARADVPAPAPEEGAVCEVPRRERPGLVARVKAAVRRD